MRKLTSILLLSSLCATLLGYHLVFHVQLALAKSQMKDFLRNDINHKDVIEFSFQDNASQKLEWEDESEFRYKGEMYDVIERKLDGSQLVLRCIADKKETALLQQYQKNNKRNASNSIIAQLITTQFLLPNDCPLDQPESVMEKKFADYSPALQNRGSTVLPQPPDAC